MDPVVGRDKEIERVIEVCGVWPFFILAVFCLRHLRHLRHFAVSPPANAISPPSQRHFTTTPTPFGPVLCSSRCSFWPFILLFAPTPFCRLRRFHHHDNAIRPGAVLPAWQVLSRRTKNNPCLIGEPGVGKTAIVEGIAQVVAYSCSPYGRSPCCSCKLTRRCIVQVRGPLQHGLSSKKDGRKHLAFLMQWV